MQEGRTSWDPNHVRYEGHYDEGLDLCYVEVFKPGKSEYSIERQDLINLPLQASLGVMKEAVRLNAHSRY